MINHQQLFYKCHIQQPSTMTLFEPGFRVL